MSRFGALLRAALPSVLRLLRSGTIAAQPDACLLRFRCKPEKRMSSSFGGVFYLFNGGNLLHVFVESACSSVGFLLEQGDSTLEGANLQLGVDDFLVDDLKLVLSRLVVRDCLVKLETVNTELERRSTWSSVLAIAR